MGVIPVRDIEVGLMLGNGGSVIKEIEEVSGAIVNIRGKQDANNRELVIIGTREQINSAMTIFRSKTQQLVIPVTNDNVGLMFGRGGSIIKEIKRASGAIINARGERGNNNRELEVLGTREQIGRAMPIIQSEIGQMVINSIQ